MKAKVLSLALLLLIAVLISSCATASGPAAPAPKSVLFNGTNVVPSELSPNLFKSGGDSVYGIDVGAITNATDTMAKLKETGGSIYVVLPKGSTQINQVLAALNKVETFTDLIKSPSWTGSVFLLNWEGVPNLTNSNLVMLRAPSQVMETLTYTPRQQESAVAPVATKVPGAVPKEAVYTVEAVSPSIAAGLSSTVAENKELAALRTQAATAPREVCIGCADGRANFTTAVYGEQISRGLLYPEYLPIELNTLAASITQEGIDELNWLIERGMVKNINIVTHADCTIMSGCGAQGLFAKYEQNAALATQYAQQHNVLYTGEWIRGGLVSSDPVVQGVYTGQNVFKGIRGRVPVTVWVLDHPTQRLIPIAEWGGMWEYTGVVPIRLTDSLARLKTFEWESEGVTPGQLTLRAQQILATNRRAAAFLEPQVRALGLENKQSFQLIAMSDQTTVTGLLSKADLGQLDRAFRVSIMLPPDAPIDVFKKALADSRAAWDYGVANAQGSLKVFVANEERRQAVLAMFKESPPTMAFLNQASPHTVEVHVVDAAGNIQSSMFVKQRGIPVKNFVVAAAKPGASIPTPLAPAVAEKPPVQFKVATQYIVAGQVKTGLFKYDPTQLEFGFFEPGAKRVALHVLADGSDRILLVRPNMQVTNELLQGLGVPMPAATNGERILTGAKGVLGTTVRLGSYALTGVILWDEISDRLGLGPQVAVTEIAESLIPSDDQAVINAMVNSEGLEKSPFFYRLKGQELYWRQEQMEKRTTKEFMLTMGNTAHARIPFFNFLNGDDILTGIVVSYAKTPKGNPVIIYSNMATGESVIWLFSSQGWNRVGNSPDSLVFKAMIPGLKGKLYTGNFRLSWVQERRSNVGVTWTEFITPEKIQVWK